MKINEVITESEQLDELSAMDVARGVGSALGKTGQVVGAAAGGISGAIDAAKSGYQAGRAFVGGQRVGGGSSPRGTSYSGGWSSGPIGYPQVVDAIPNMNPEELKNLKQQIDTALQQPQDTNQPANQQQTATTAPSKPVRGQIATVNGKTYMFAGQQWVDERDNIAKGEDLKQIKDMFARGEIGPPPAERPEELGGKPSKASPVPDQKKLIQALSKLTPDQVETVRSMLTAKVQGQQNVAEGIGDAIKAGWNKLKNLGGLSFEAIKKAIEQMSPEDAKGLLAQLPAPKSAGSQGLSGLTAPTLQPKDQGYVTTKMSGKSTPGSITTGGVTQVKPGAAQAPAKEPAKAQPAPPESPYGQLTGDESAFVAAREKEGLTPDQIQTALANRRARRTKPAATAPAGQKTYAAPEKSQAKRTTDYKFYPKGGINPSTKLSDIGPVGAAAKKTAANEGFYSKFLDKKI